MVWDYSIFTYIIWDHFNNIGVILRLSPCQHGMMTSSHENIFRVTGLLWGEFTGHRWIPHTKVSVVELWCFLDVRRNKGLCKQSRRRIFETPLHSLCRHYDEWNDSELYGWMNHINPPITDDKIATKQTWQKRMNVHILPEIRGIDTNGCNGQPITSLPTFL